MRTITKRMLAQRLEDLEAMFPEHKLVENNSNPTGRVRIYGLCFQGKNGIIYPLGRRSFAGKRNYCDAIGIAINSIECFRKELVK